jgi:hypothetical protein
MKIQQTDNGCIVVEFEEGEKGVIEIRKDGDEITVSHYIEHPDRELPLEILGEYKLINPFCNGIYMKDANTRTGWIGWRRESSFEVVEGG